MIPSIAWAATTLPIISKINTYIINPLIGFLIALSVVIFVWGVVETITAEGEKRDEGKTHMIYGVIGLFIMVSAIGILNVICNTIGCN